MENLSPFRQEAAHGHRESKSWRLMFLKRDPINLREAERCLDRLDAPQPDEGERRVLAMDRERVEYDTVCQQKVSHQVGQTLKGDQNRVRESRE